MQRQSWLHSLQLQAVGNYRKNKIVPTSGGEPELSLRDTVGSLRHSRGAQGRADTAWH